MRLSRKIVSMSLAALLSMSLMNYVDAEGSNERSEINAEELEYDMNTGVAKAIGGVKIKHDAEGSESSSLNADEVEYHMNEGIITAVGNVLLRYGDGAATGTQAMNNLNTKEAQLIGNVIVERDGFRLTCEQLINDGVGHMLADGNVYGEQRVDPTADNPEGDVRTFAGDHVDYYPEEKKHVIIPRGGRVESKSEGTFTADHMEGWLDDEYYCGMGNAHVVSPPRNLEAGGDRVDYYGQENGKAVLTGNAWAYQDNNTLRGNRVTVYLNNEKKTDQSTKPMSPAAPKMIDEPSFDAPFSNPTMNQPATTAPASNDINVADDVKAPTMSPPIEDQSVDKTLEAPFKDESSGAEVFDNKLTVDKAAVSTDPKSNDNKKSAPKNDVEPSPRDDFGNPAKINA